MNTKAILSALVALFIGLPVFAEEPPSVPKGNPVAQAAETDADELAKGAKAWGEQTKRAPIGHHAQFYTGKEYTDKQWETMMALMSARGGIPFDEAMGIAKVLGANAPKAGGDEWWRGTAWYLSGKLESTDGEFETLKGAFNPHVYLLWNRFLLELEPEFAGPLAPDEDFKFEGMEWANLYYFAGDHVIVSGGKFANELDGVYNTRERSPFLNAWITNPFTGKVIGSIRTLGGKVQVNYPMGENVIIDASAFAGVGDESTWIGVDTGAMLGTRIGARLPKYEAEAGLTVGQVGEEHEGFSTLDKIVFGGYAIKQFGPVRTEGAFATDFDRTAWWIGGTARPWDTGLLSYLEPAFRYQELYEKKDAKELYTGVNVVPWTSGIVTLKLGLAFDLTGDGDTNVQTQLVLKY